jgi:CubicO group peptidase (beta-lactamase class C family)
MKISIIKSILALLTIFYLLTVCCKNVDVNSENGANGEYKIPEFLNDGWEVASLNSVGMEKSYFENLLNRLNRIGEHRIHSILVVKDKKLVFEKYYPGRKFNLAQYTGETGFDINDTHNLCSATKSFTSALIGIALDKGYIKSIDQKVFDFFPEFEDLLLLESEKNKMTIKHLLTMTSGLEWDDETLPYSDPRNDLHRMFVNDNPIRFALAKPLFAAPGDVFDYANCNTNILGEIIRKASGERLDKFADKYLFKKLGITELEWQMLPNDAVFCSGDLRLRPRDMAKFGLLFLNRGEWNGEQIISQKWSDISTAAYLNPNDYNKEFGWADGYGFQWWQKTYYYNSQSYSSFFATGWGGQHIIDFPALNLVIVFTGGNYYEAEIISPYDIVSNYILPSIIN